MADTPSKTEYNFYLGEHGMNKQLTDEYFKDWKGSRSLKSFKQHKNLPNTFQEAMGRSLLKKLIPNRRSKTASMYKEN